MTETKDKTKLLRKAWQRPKSDFVSCAFDLPEVAALQALQAGTATSEQQQRAINWIITHACGFYELSFTDDARLSDFSEGRRFVGKQIVNMLSLNKETLTARRSEQ